MIKDNKQKTYIIYKATNIANNKIYIGKTTEGLDKRMRRHLRNCKIRKQTFQLALNKYGKESFQWEVLDSSAKDLIQLNILEKKYIQQHKEKFILYNMTDGGDGAPGKKHTEESKQKMREKALARPSFTAEHRKNIGLSNSLKIVSQATRLKMSLKQKGRIKSPEECLKISQSKKGKKINVNHIR